MPTVTDLGQRVKAKHPGKYDDLADDELGRRVRAKYPGKYDDFADSVGADPTMMTAENNPVAQFMARLKGRALGALPAAGGLAGGVLGAGTPARIPLAAAGGAVGEAGKELLGGEPLSAESIGKAGAEQGAYELAGGLAAKGASKLARPIMRGAMRLGKAIGGEVKVGTELFPDPVETALREGIQINPEGALKAKALRRAKGSEIGSLLQKETAAGREIKTSDVIKHAKELLKSRTLKPEKKAKVFNELMGLYRQHGARMDPELAQLIKRERGDAFKNWKAGKDPLTTPIAARVDQEISRGAGEALDVIPGMSELNAEYAARKGADIATDKAVRMRDPLTQVQAPSTYPVLRGLLANKSLNSKIAIKLADPEFQKLLRQSPRLAAAMLESAFYTDEPDATAR